MNEGDYDLAWFSAMVRHIEEKRAKPRSVSSPRYPFTYAYDFVKLHADEFGLPQEHHGSRIGVAKWLRHQLGVGSEHDLYKMVCYTLADAYLREYNIVLAD